ncbi:hypothetical protein FKM82_019970 [Ascaphus truei]
MGKFPELLDGAHNNICTKIEREAEDARADRWDGHRLDVAVFADMTKDAVDHVRQLRFTGSTIICRPFRSHRVNDLLTGKVSS